MIKTQVQTNIPRGSSFDPNTRLLNCGIPKWCPLTPPDLQRRVEGTIKGHEKFKIIRGGGVVGNGNAGRGEPHFTVSGIRTTLYIWC